MGFQIVENLVEMTELVTYLLMVVRKSRHSHNTVDYNVLQLLKTITLQHLLALFKSKTEFGLLVSYMELQQTRYHAVVFESVLIHFLK